MENDEKVTIESGSLPLEKSCELARFHDELGSPERLVVIGSKDSGESFSYTRCETDMQTFEDSTLYDMPAIHLFADLLAEFCEEYNADPLVTISSVEQLILEN